MSRGITGTWRAAPSTTTPRPWTVPTIIATVVAFVVGYASIAFLLKYLRTHTLAVFVIYRIAFATLVLGLLAAGAIS